MRKMVSQLSGVDLSGDPSPSLERTFHEAADRFEQLPMYFMKFFGSSDIDQVLDAMVCSASEASASLSLPL